MSYGNAQFSLSNFSWLVIELGSHLEIPETTIGDGVSRRLLVSCVNGQHLTKQRHTSEYYAELADRSTASDYVTTTSHIPEPVLLGMSVLYECFFFAEVST